MRGLKNICFLWREVWHLKSSMVLLSCFQTVLESIAPFVTIIFPSLILNELVNGKRMRQITVYILSMAVSYFLIQCFLHLIRHAMITGDMRIGNEFGNSCAYKQMTMDYQYCENDRVLNLLDQYSLFLKRFFKRQTPGSFGLVFCDVLQTALFYLYGAFEVIVGRIAVGTFQLLLTSASQLQAAVMQLLSSLQEVSQLSRYVEIYQEYLSLVMERSQASGDAVLDSGESDVSLEFKNVSFTYPGAERETLHDVSFCIAGGRRVAFAGANGSGKTTIVKLICRFYQPTKGTILLNGRDIFDYDQEEYRRQIRVLLQDYKIMAFSVGENIALNMRMEEGRVWECLDESGIGDKVRSLKQGLGTFLFKEFSPEGVELSGGESQKLALARERYQGGLLWIFDEPTASLDPIAEYEFYQKLNEITEAKTCIYISHRLYSVRDADHILVFREGRLEEEGSHQELMESRGLYREMFEKQAGLYGGKSNEKCSQGA